MDNDLQFLEDALNDIEYEKMIRTLRQTTNEDLCQVMTRTALLTYHLGVTQPVSGVEPDIIKKIKGHLDGCYLCNEKYRDISDEVDDIKKVFAQAFLRQDSERSSDKFRYDLLKKIEEDMLKELEKGEVSEAKLYFGLAEIACGLHIGDKVKEYYQKAADAGHPDAIQRLNDFSGE